MVVGDQATTIIHSKKTLLIYYVMFEWFRVPNIIRNTDSIYCTSRAQLKMSAIIIKRIKYLPGLGGGSGGLE